MTGSVFVFSAACILLSLSESLSVSARWRWNSCGTGWTWWTWPPSSPSSSPSSSRPWTISSLLVSRHTDKKEKKIFLIHCKKIAIFSSPAGMSLIKLSLAGNNFWPGRVWLLVTSQLGTGKSLALFTVQMRSGAKLYTVWLTASLDMVKFCAFPHRLLKALPHVSLCTRSHLHFRHI